MRIEMVIQMKSTPEQDGYPDTLLLSIGEHLVFACPASSNPNPFTPSNPALKWSDAYGCIAAGTYNIEVVNHKKYGICVLLNGGGYVDARYPNPAHHKGKPVMTEVFVHSGQSRAWRGSAGCPTVHPMFWPCFQYFLDVGQKGTITLLPALVCAEAVPV
jgi:hypothetical protein